MKCLSKLLGAKQDADYSHLYVYLVYSTSLFLAPLSKELQRHLQWHLIIKCLIFESLEVRVRIMGPASFWACEMLRVPWKLASWTSDRKAQKSAAAVSSEADSMMEARPRWKAKLQRCGASIPP